ncbi:MAG: cyclophane-forming radical SAM/SPASM peptide maturase GrrM/OscB [Gammaproteobacteria bacterium]
MDSKIIVIQPTSLCNFNCSYCYLPGREQRDVMTFETLDKIFKIAFHSIENDGFLHFNWHSGEPLLMKINFYETALTMIKKYNKYNISYMNSIQTNGALINEKWCDFFKRNNFNICVSIDGPSFLHDANRRTWSNRPTHVISLKGLKLLNDFAISHSILAVLTRESLKYPVEMYNFLIENNINSIGFNLEEISGSNLSSSIDLLSAKEDIAQLYTNFINTFFDLWKKDDCKIQVREFRDILNFLNEKKKNNNYIINKYEQNGLSIISILKNGDISTFSPEMANGDAEDTKKFIIGNIHSITHFSDLLNSESYLNISKAVKSGQEKCRAECAYFDICGGGYPAIKYYEHGKFDCTETTNCVLTVQSFTDILLEKLTKDSL